ncbi:unnamed protein product [Miscanthus lutarioriparius]|uniref:Annexin n=1 Tax=Miscanthus lutarioriparius TaxID=422564 RepID=A0A811QNZ7_9POAL|nr:unnamed protein product [Miscanthus lutarioriparius]
MLLWVLDPATRDATILKQALTGDVTDLRAATGGLLPGAVAAAGRAPGVPRQGPASGGWGQTSAPSSASSASGAGRTWRPWRARTTTYDRSLESAVKSETSGNFCFGLLTVLRCADSPARYFARVLHKAMKGLGTSDSALIRVVVSRAEIDMQFIKAEYHRMYKRSLADAIHAETSGHYRTFLLSLVGRDRTC